VAAPDVTLTTAPRQPCCAQSLIFGNAATVAELAATNYFAAWMTNPVGPFLWVFRYTLLATGPRQTHLHLAYAINFKPSLNRLVRPMVAKGVDGEKQQQQQQQQSNTPRTTQFRAAAGHGCMLIGAVQFMHRLYTHT